MTEGLPSNTSVAVIGPLPAEAIAQMSGLDIVRAMMEGRLPADPISRHLGYRVIEAAEGRTVFEGRPSPAILNPQGTVHGGWIATVLDSAMGAAVHTLLKPGEIFVTTSMTNNFLRAVRADSGVVRCEGSAIHRGRTLAAAEARLIDESGKLVAHGMQTCAIIKHRGDPP